jgi:hypothetical protein
VYVDGSIDSGASITSNNGLSTFQPSYAGCNDLLANAFIGRIFLIAQFDTDVSSSAADLNDDWFGTLFDVSGASGVAIPVAMSHYARLRAS